MVLLSGGLDSATCLALAVKEKGKDNVIALNTYYGQKHKKEQECAEAIADHYGVSIIKLDINDVMKYSDCPLLEHSDREIEHSTYAEQTTGHPVATYVPFRNGVLLSIATAIGMSLGADTIWYGAHADDAAGSAYPDCSTEFVRKMNEAIREGTDNAVVIDAPFKRMNKSGVVKMGLELGVPFELTWSCYEGGEKPCGKCATCLDRAKAFSDNGTIDPALSCMQKPTIKNYGGTN